ncbi:MAG: hypothetical protein M1816_005523 [Peltula sp. TS41687]|nr:MAG: hypothetical protein M1816_005523 [Peltula sp. TS41687]
MVQIRRVPPPLVTVWLTVMMKNIMWSEIEISVLIVCANLPGIYALVKRPSASSAIGGSKRSPYYHGYADGGYTRRGASISARGVSHDLRDEFDLPVKDETSIEPSAHGPRTTTMTMASVNSSEERIIQTSQPDEGIHMSTKIVVNVV